MRLGAASVPRIGRGQTAVSTQGLVTSAVGAVVAARRIAIESLVSSMPSFSTGAVFVMSCGIQRRIARFGVAPVLTLVSDVGALVIWNASYVASMPFETLTVFVTARMTGTTTRPAVSTLVPALLYAKTGNAMGPQPKTA
jgi:hypothetical protein